MVAIRQLRQPNVIAYPPTPVVLEARINAAFDALLASADEPLTDEQWNKVFALWDCRRLLASSDPADWQLIAQTIEAVRS